MPIYEYQCITCEHRFERLQKINDEPVEVCPECGEKVRKLLSAPAFRFKGSGWYVTDYADKGKKPPSETDSGGDSAGKSDDKSAKDSDSSSKSSSDSKPSKAKASSPAD